MVYFFDAEPGRDDYIFIDIEGNIVNPQNITSLDTVYCWDNSIDQQYLNDNNIYLKLTDYQIIWMKKHNVTCKKRLTKTYRRYGLKGYGGIRWHTAAGDAEALRRIYILELEGAPLVYG